MDYTEQSSTFDRQKTTYMRTWIRNIPSNNLQPYLDVRPVQTKYSTDVFITNATNATNVSVPIVQQPTYSTKHVFNPGNDLAPWSGFASNIDVETDLRNQKYALQCSPQAVYVPSSNSSLYNYKWTNKTANKTANNKQNTNTRQQEETPFPELFATQHQPMQTSTQTSTQTNCETNNDDIGHYVFNNSTRL